MSEYVDPFTCEHDYARGGSKESYWCHDCGTRKIVSERLSEQAKQLEALTKVLTDIKEDYEYCREHGPRNREEAYYREICEALQQESNDG